MAKRLLKKKGVKGCLDIAQASFFFFPWQKGKVVFKNVSVEVKLWFKMLSSQKETLEEFLGYIIKTLIFHEEWLSNNKNKLKVKKKMQLSSFEQESFTWKLTTKNFIKLDCSKSLLPLPFAKIPFLCKQWFQNKSCPL